MNRGQRRDLGLLPRQVLADVRALAKEGAIDSNTAPKEIALLVAMERASEESTCEAWDAVMDGTYEIDWDEVMRMLEMLIELLIKYLPLLI